MNPRRTHASSVLHFLVDVLAIVGAYYTTLRLRFHSPWGEQFFTWVNQTLGVRETGVVGDPFRDFYVDSAPRIIFFLVVVLGALYALRDLYAQRRYLNRRSAAWNIIVCNVIALALFYTYFYLQRNLFHPRSMFATILTFNCIFATALRALIDTWLRHRRARHDADGWRVIMVGCNRDADRIREIIATSPDRDLRLAEQLDLAAGEPFDAVLQRVRDAVARHDAQLVILADARCAIGQIMQFLEMADQLDVAVKILSRELDVLLTRARIDSDLIHGIPLVHFAAPSTARRYERIKSLSSPFLAAAALLLLAPFLLVLALAIRLTSRGPVIYIQERIGVNHRPFRMFKFRTMVAGADQARDALAARNQAGSGGLFKLRNDPRVTWLGRVLRRYSLDELPQLANVVRGDMTLVGPRPLPRRDFESYYADWHYGRHGGLPGLTCLWQVSGRSELDFHSMCILDVYYLRNQSPVLDVKILWRTVWVALFARGAY